MIGKKGLLRIVKDRDGNVFLDPTGKKNGRGAYICNDIKCFEGARKKKALERSLKCKIPDSVYESLNAHIAEGAEGEMAFNAGKSENVEQGLSHSENNRQRDKGDG